jgi:ribonucleoside-diphosphate reductase beta chain
MTETYSIYNLSNTKHHTQRTSYLDESVDIQRFDTMRYPKIHEHMLKQLGYIWTPEETRLERDQIDYKNAPPEITKKFDMILSRQALMDSVQGRGPSMALGPIASLPEVEGFLNVWTTFEGPIHSRSYTHMIKNVYTDPGIIFDHINDNKFVVSAANHIARYYNALIEYNCLTMNGTRYGTKHSKLEHARRLLRCLAAINALEGIWFTNSFVVTWNWQQNDSYKMFEGSAKILKQIAQDEMLHCTFVSWQLRDIPKESALFEQAFNDVKDELVEIYVMSAQLEKEFSSQLCETGPVLGVNETILHDYIDFRAAATCKAAGLKYPKKAPSKDPVPWTRFWYNTGKEQAALQETENAEYQHGIIDTNINVMTIAELGRI